MATTTTMRYDRVFAVLSGTFDSLPTSGFNVPGRSQPRFIEHSDSEGADLAAGGCSPKS